MKRRRDVPVVLCECPGDVVSMLCWERQMCQSERAVSSETRGGQSLHEEPKLSSSKSIQETQVDLFMVKHNLRPNKHHVFNQKI